MCCEKQILYELLRYGGSASRDLARLTALLCDLPDLLPIDAMVLDKSGRPPRRSQHAAVQSRFVPKVPFLAILVGRTTEIDSTRRCNWTPVTGGSMNLSAPSASPREDAPR